MKKVINIDKEILDDFPSVNSTQIQALLTMSQDLVINLSKVARENIA